MAIASWAGVTPKTGTGNGTISVSGQVHTGRVERNFQATFKVEGLADTLFPVKQAAKPEFVTVTANINTGKAAGTVTITGKTNSSKLTFALGGGDIAITLPTNYTAKGVSTANAANIAGDPGADAEFDFSISIPIPANTTIVAKTRQITVTTAGGQKATATITQEKGDPTLSLSPTSVTLDAAGTAQTVTVTSNATWTIE